MLWENNGKYNFLLLILFSFSFFSACIKLGNGSGFNGEEETFLPQYARHKIFVTFYLCPCDFDLVSLPIVLVAAIIQSLFILLRTGTTPCAIKLIESKLSLFKQIR